MADRMGIDFGTSTTLVSNRAGEGPVRVLPIGQVDAWMPSLVGYGSNGVVVGEDALALPERSVIRSIKTDLLTRLSVRTISPPMGPTVDLEVRPAITDLLAEVAARCEQRGFPLVGRPVRLSCPANWPAAPRLDLVRAAKDAGLDASVNRMLDEPISAGVAWTMGRFLAGKPAPEGKVLVFDYGGGTLDLAVLEVVDGSPPEITVLAAAAVTEAGDRLDQAIAGELRAEAEHHPALAALDMEPEDVQHLFRLAATRLKIGLSTTPEQATRLGPGPGANMVLRYSQRQLETAFSPMLDRALRLVWSTIRATELRRRGAATPDVIRKMTEGELAKGISWVLLAGGMSRIPAVAARLTQAFPSAAVAADTSLRSPEESVVSGLAYDEVVSDLNLDRPAFDMTVELVDPSGLCVANQHAYPAFTPLYAPDQIQRGEFLLGRSAEITNPTKKRVTAKMTCRGVDGRTLPLYIDGVSEESLDVSVEPGKTVWFKLYVDGQVVLGYRQLRVDRWPVIRGGPNNRIEFVTDSRGYDDQRVGHWWGERN